MSTTAVYNPFFNSLVLPKSFQYTGQKELQITIVEQNEDISEGIEKKLAKKQGLAGLKGVLKGLEIDLSDDYGSYLYRKHSQHVGSPRH